MFVQWPGNLRRRSVGETRAPPLPRISHQRELADYKRFAFDIQKRQVEFSFVTRKYPDVCDLLREIFSITSRIIPGDAEQHDKPAPNHPDGFTIDGDRAF